MRTITCCPLFLAAMTCLGGVGVQQARADVAPAYFYKRLICVQKGSVKVVPHKLPTLSNPVTCDPTYANQLWTLLNAPGIAPEIKQMFTFSGPTESPPSPPPDFVPANFTFNFVIVISPQLTFDRVLGVEPNDAIAWSAWTEARYDKLQIGLSSLLFNTNSQGGPLYTMLMHQTATMLQEFWAPWLPPNSTNPPPTDQQPPLRDFNTGAMPFFESYSSVLATSAGDPKVFLNAALYNIIVHEVAHYFEAAYGIYYYDAKGTKPIKRTTGAGAGCNGTGYYMDPASFAAISWTEFSEDSAIGYVPPWFDNGIWGCAARDPNNARPAYPPVTRKLNFMLKQAVPPSPGNLDFPFLSSFLNTLYSDDTVMPTTLAATSPEEDFADSYTMLTLYRAGLDELVLNIPDQGKPDAQPPVLPDEKKDQKIYVVNKLFTATTTNGVTKNGKFRSEKASWICANLLEGKFHLKTQDERGCHP